MFLNIVNQFFLALILFRQPYKSSEELKKFHSRQGQIFSLVTPLNISI